MQSSLPHIKQMYSSTRENKDFNVIRKYQNLSKTQQTKQSVTRKGHYLDDQVKSSCSPGPANKANLQAVWSAKNLHQQKYSNRRTYIDDVQRLAKKQSLSSPNKYNLMMPWPKKQSKQKLICQKASFVDTSQFQGAKTPGPGSYIVATRISKQQKQNKYVTHHSLQPRQATKADMNTYNPCPADFDTFMKYSMVPKQKNLQRKRSNQSIQKLPKKESPPGPGAYQVINTWRGKEPLKKNQLSYLNSITKGPSMNVYYH